MTRVKTAVKKIENVQNAKTVAKAKTLPKIEKNDLFEPMKKTVNQEATKKLPN